MTPQARLERLRELGQAQVKLGDFAAALPLYEEALAAARELGDAGQTDLAVCNRAAALIALRRGDAEIPRLREILMRSTDLASSRLAAYNIAVFYDFADENKKALFYARIALDRSRQLGRPDWIASSLNQAGNALLAESQIPDAVALYEQALDLMPGEERLGRCFILINLGYCRVLQGRNRDGLTLLYRALRDLRTQASPTHRVMAHLDLSFGLLEAGRLRLARRHAEAGLRLAERHDDADGVKNALYLIGEAASLGGDEERALDSFGRLQRRFYPDSPFLAEFLLSVDVRKLVNLHA